MMRRQKCCVLLSVLGVCGWRSESLRRRRHMSSKGQTDVIAASTVLDGRRVLRDARIVVEGSKIVAVETRVETKVDKGAGRWTTTCAD